MNYRNPKLTALARGAPCMVNVPGVCNRDPATTVWAHSNQLRHGKGKGIKAHDIFGALACSSCHDFIDGRSRAGYRGAVEPVTYWQIAHERTILYLFERGLVGVL